MVTIAGALLCAVRRASLPKRTYRMVCRAPGSAGTTGRHSVRLQGVRHCAVPAESTREPYNFRGDNAVGMTDAVLEAVVSTNKAPATVEWSGYGADPATAKLQSDTASFFGMSDDSAAHLSVRPVITGTAANDLLLFALTRAAGGDAMSAVLCSECSHIFTDELALAGGVKLVPIPASPGCHAKITPADVDLAMERYRKSLFGGVAVLSISQPTESGTVYSSDELRRLCDTAHRHSLLVHMDGARFLNAVASSGSSPAELSWSAGVDALSLGGSKAGGFSDAAVVFDTKRVPINRMALYAKQRGHLASKHRFLACQLSALLTNGHGVQSAARANMAARRLAAGLIDLGFTLRHPVEANSVFVTLPELTRDSLEELGFGFFLWDGRPDTEPGETRFVCSFETTDSDVDDLLSTMHTIEIGGHFVLQFQQ